MGSEGHRKRLRDRFISVGLRAFSPHEQLELLLTLSLPRKDVKDVAKALLGAFGNLKGVLDAPVEDIKQIPGIGEVGAIQLKLVKEIASLYLQQEAEKSDTAESLENLWRIRLGDLKHEVFEVAFLDAGLRLIKDGVQRLHEGTIDRAAVYPRRVIEEAVRRKAAGLVLAHNHTNGKPHPSEQDKTLTQAIIHAGLNLQVRVIDHMIFSGNEVFSFRKAGLL